MSEKKSLLEHVMNFFRFVPKKKTVDKSKDDEADDVQSEKTESYSTDKIQRHKAILNLSKELAPPKQGTRPIRSFVPTAPATRSNGTTYPPRRT